MSSSSSDARRPGLGAVVRSEWTKLWSVRSTLWTVVALLAVTLGFSALICAVTGTADVGDSEFDATAQSLVGLYFGQVAAIVLGVLCVTSEYSKGGIRTTLTAVPNRVRLVLAKAIVVAAVTLVVGLAASFGSFFLGQSLLSGDGASVTLGDQDVLRAVVGGALYFMACGLFGYALGLVLRQSAGAITGGLVLLFVAPPLITLIPGSTGETLSEYFTSNAGQSLFVVRQLSDTLGPWTGYGVFTLWWLVPLLLGTALMVRRDAA